MWERGKGSHLRKFLKYRKLFFAARIFWVNQFDSTTLEIKGKTGIKEVFLTVQLFSDGAERFRMRTAAMEASGRRSQQIMVFSLDEGL